MKVVLNLFYSNICIVVFSTTDKISLRGLLIKNLQIYSMLETQNSSFAGDGCDKNTSNLDRHTQKNKKFKQNSTSKNNTTNDLLIELPKTNDQNCSRNV